MKTLLGPQQHVTADKGADVANSSAVTACRVLTAMLFAALLSAGACACGATSSATAPAALRSAAASAAPSAPASVGDRPALDSPCSYVPVATATRVFGESFTSKPGEVEDQCELDSTPSPGDDVIVTVGTGADTKGIYQNSLVNDALSVPITGVGTKAARSTDGSNIAVTNGTSVVEIGAAGFPQLNTATLAHETQQLALDVLKKLP